MYSALADYYTNVAVATALATAGSAAPSFPAVGYLDNTEGVDDNMPI